jgi:3-isopropylmalate/(R)-2-methylmalate dehydratase small subunit
MRKFENLDAVAAALPMINIDTDKIIPARFLKTIKRSGLGKSLLYTLRYDEAGNERPDFVLNKAPWREAKILIAGENFGCGSSREHAPWALDDFGIRCVISESFADIFFSNSFKNGMLLIKLPKAEIETLMADANKGDRLAIDLPNQTIRRADGSTIRFEIDPFLKTSLIEGLDEVALTLQKQTFIKDYETKQRQAQPWLWR